MIGSDNPDVPHYIARHIRHRYVVDNSKNIILYKTYTLLSIGTRVIGTLSTTEEDQKGHFIIRGSYSNLYWGANEQEKKDIELHYAGVRNEIKLLFGRYDFSTVLSEVQFSKIFNEIRFEKLGGEKSLDRHLLHELDDENILYRIISFSFLSINIFHI